MASFWAVLNGKKNSEPHCINDAKIDTGKIIEVIKQENLGVRKYLLIPNKKNVEKFLSLMSLVKNEDLKKIALG